MSVCLRYAHVVSHLIPSLLHLSVLFFSVFLSGFLPILDNVCVFHFLACYPNILCPLHGYTAVHRCELIIISNLSMQIERVRCELCVSLVGIECV